MKITLPDKLTKEEVEKIKLRFSEYANILRMSLAEFAMTAGLDRRYIPNMTGRPSLKTYEAIEATYPALNLNWVFFGTGEMINPDYKDNPKKVVPHPKQTINTQAGATTFVEGNVSGKVVNAQINIPDDDEHHFTLDFLWRKLNEKDSIIMEKDKLIKELYDKILKLTESCK